MWNLIFSLFCIKFNGLYFYFIQVDKVTFTYYHVVIIAIRKIILNIKHRAKKSFIKIHKISI